jgi:thiol-disulfide isomerase/thioredoxin
MQPSVEQKGNELKMSPNDWNWEITNIDGVPSIFKSFEGKVIFLNFWATWCPPCVGEMPEIQGLYDFYKDNPNIAFIMVSNEETETVKKFIEKRSYTFPVYTSKYQAPEIFYSQSIPITFLIAKDGRIVIREVGATKWNGKKMRDIIESLIKE